MDLGGGETTGGCSRLLNEESYNLHSSYSISRGDQTKEDEMYGAVVCMRMKCMQVFSGKNLKAEVLGNNIKMEFI